MPNQHLYVDVISWLNFFRIIHFRNYQLHVLDDFEKSNYYAQKLLDLLGVNIIYEEFHSSELYVKNEDEPIYLKAFKISSDLSLEYSRSLVKKSTTLSRINNKYGNNTVSLFLAKSLQIYLFEYVKKLKAYQALTFKMENTRLLIDAPYIIDSYKLTKTFPELSIIFYSKHFNVFKGFYFHLIKELFIRVKTTIFTINRGPKKDQNIKNGVLSIQEDSIRLDQSLRGHYHWADFDKWQENPLHTISLNHGSSRMVKNIEQLRKNNIFIYKRDIFKKARKNVELRDDLLSFKKDIYSLWKSLFFTRNVFEKFYILKTIFLMYKALDLALVCIYLNIKTYIIKESYFIYSDAIQLASKQLGVKTLAYQYSNLGYRSPLMMSSSDVYLYFSKNYRDLFEYCELGPKTFKEMGYTSAGVEFRLLNKVEKIKKILKKNGAEFTIVYFDEANSESKWRLIKTQEYKQHIVDLAQKVIDDPTLGVLIKTQFKRNVLHKKFKNDSIVQQALNSGRLIDVYTGVLRNDVYPVQVALAADICINDMVGATAGLEAVDAGKRCLLLNGYNYKTLHHEQYQKANIVYRDLGSALNAIDIHRKKLANGLKSDLGDWGKIKPYFLSDLKESGIKKIKEEVGLLLNSQ